MLWPQIKLSVIVPSRNEFPDVAYTCYSIIHALEAEGYDWRDYEIIIVDNASDDTIFEKPGTGGTTTYMMGRGMFGHRVLRVVHYPIAGNHAARNKGAEVARGEYIFFVDAHVAFKPGFFTNLMKAVDESGGIVHGAKQDLGAYPPFERSMGYGYSLKLGEEIRGNWNNYKVADSWFYVPAQGHWGLCVKKKQFLNFGGYPKIHRTYGGGEFYLNMKWWMFGSLVATEPHAIGYHLAAARNYGYDQMDYVHNVLNISYALGMDDWRERAYINYLRTKNPERLKFIMEEGEREMAEDRAFIEKRRKYTFNEVLAEQPWDKKNMERHGNSYGAITIYHDSWLELLEQSPLAKKAYEESKYQKGLEEFINSKMSEFVYLRR